MPQQNNKPITTSLDIRSLREQVYEYFRREIQMGRLVPGAFINLTRISEQLGISKTPLRDALIKLECDGFVTILPRRGIVVNKLTLDEIKNIVEILGALESTVIVSVFDKIKLKHIKKMKTINADLKDIMRNSKSDTFDQQYYELNIAFHNVFLDLSCNDALKDIITPLKQRMYDFPRLTYISEWELINCDEHDQLIELLTNGRPEKAAKLWREFHWSFTAHEQFIREFYAQGNKQIQHVLDNTPQ